MAAIDNLKIMTTNQNTREQINKLLEYIGEEKEISEEDESESDSESDVEDHVEVKILINESANLLSPIAE